MTAMFMGLTPFQATMIALAVLEMGVIFALLRHVPKTPATRRLNAITTALAGILIVAVILERVGWIH